MSAETARSHHGERMLEDRWPRETVDEIDEIEDQYLGPLRSVSDMSSEDEYVHGLGAGMPVMWRVEVGVMGNRNAVSTARRFSGILNWTRELRYWLHVWCTPPSRHLFCTVANFIQQKLKFPFIERKFLIHLRVSRKY